MSGRLLTSLMILLLAAAGRVSARSDAVADTIYEFPPVIIVGKAIVDQTTIRDNGSKVSSVSAIQIRDLNATDLPSALRRVPGVTISRYNLVGSYGGGEGGTIYIRGQGTSRPGAAIQTMVDGVPKFSGVWTHPLMDILDVDRAEQIDVYKSPQSVQYGNMSLGAVNMVTRRMHSPGHRTSMTAIGGQESTYSLNFTHGGKSGAFDYYFGGTARGSEGHRENADGQLRSWWGRSGYQFNDNWNASVIVSGSDNWADDPGPVGGTTPTRGRFNTSDYSVNATLSNRSDRTSGFLRFYADDGAIGWEQWSNTTNNWFNTETDWLNSGIRIQQNVLLSDATELTLGFDYDNYGGEVWEQHADPVNDKRLPEANFSNTAGYAQLRHTFDLGGGTLLQPSAGARFNHHNTFDDQFAPELGVTLGREKWTVFGNYTRGFNYAGVYSVWFYDVTWNQPDGYKDLKAELVNHYELGLKLQPSPRAAFEFSVFHDRGSDRIRMVPPPPPPPVFVNIDNYEITGFETSFSWNPHGSLSLFTGLTLLSMTPESMPQSPGYTFTVGGNYRFLKKFQLSTDLSAVDEKYVINGRFANLDAVPLANIPRTDSYVMVNAKLSYTLGRIGASRHGSQLFVAVENLTGADYEYKPGYPMPGATAMFGLTVDY